MLELLQEIPFAIPKPVGYIKKNLLLTDIGSKWFMDKHRSKLPPMQKPILSNIKNNKEDNIKNLKKLINIGMVVNS